MDEVACRCDPDPWTRAILAMLGAEKVADGVYVVATGSLDEPEGEW